MNKITNMIGSFIVAVSIIACPVIVGIGIAGDWLRTENGVIVHPLLAWLWIICDIGTMTEVGLLGFMISNSEVI